MILKIISISFKYLDISKCWSCVGEIVAAAKDCIEAIKTGDLVKCVDGALKNINPDDHCFGCIENVLQKVPSGIDQGRELYCPQGHKFYSPSKQFNEVFKVAFEEHCQCDCCKYGEMQSTWDEVGCSGGFIGHSGLKF